MHAGRIRALEIVSVRVMKDQAERVTFAAANLAHAVPQIHPMIPAPAFDRAMADGKDRGVSLPQIQHLDA